MCGYSSKKWEATPNSCLYDAYFATQQTKLRRARRVPVALSPTSADRAAALPYGQLPVMEVDGVVIPQSSAQLRYVGKTGGLYPTDPVQAAFADAAVDAVIDIHIPMRASIVGETDAEKKVRAVHE